MSAWQVGALVVLGLFSIACWDEWRYDRARAARLAALEAHHATVPGLIDWTAWEREVTS